MARRERSVEFSVKARDEYSKIMKDVARQQEKLSATAKASNRRQVLGVAEAEFSDAIENYKRLTAEVERYRRVQANGAASGALSKSELREVGDAIKLVRDRSREAAAAIQTKRAALAALNTNAATGFSAMSRLATAMQEEARAAAASATAQQRAVAESTRKIEIQNRLSNAIRSGFGDWSRYTETVERHRAAEERSAAIAARKTEIQGRLNTAASTGFRDWSRYASVIDQVRAADERAATVAQRRAEVQARINAMAQSGFGAWSRYADAIDRNKTAAEKEWAVFRRKLEIQGRLGQQAKSGYVDFIRAAEGMQKEGTAAAGATTQLNKLASATAAAAAAQAGLKGKVDAANNSLAKQARRGGKSGAKGDAQEIELYGLKPWQMTNLGYQINDVVSGLAMGQNPLQIFAQQAGQIAQIWPQVMVGFVRAAPVLLGLGAAFAPVIAAASRMHDVAVSVKQFSAELALSADGGRYSADALALVVKRMGDIGIATEDARKIVKAFVKDGLSSTQFEPLAKMAKQLSDLTGEGVAEAAARLSKAFSGNVDGVIELDKELNFLTEDQYKSIRAMDDAGNRTGALSLAQKFLQERLAATKQEATSWGNAVKAMAEAWDALVEMAEKTGAIDLAKEGLDRLAKAATQDARDIKKAADLISRGLAAIKGPDDPNLKRLAELRAGEDSIRSFMDSGVQQGDPESLAESLASLKEIADERAKILALIEAEFSAKSLSLRKSDEALAADRKAVEGAIAGQQKIAAEQARLAGLSERDLAVEKGLRETILELQKKNIDLTKEQITAQKEVLRAAYDAAKTNTYLELNSSATGSFANKVSGVESSGNANAKNPLSSATGLGQFIESTWLAMFKKYFPDRAAGMTDAMILELRKDAQVSRTMIELYAKENASVLQKAGLAVNDASLYLAHFLGPNGAAAVLKAARDAPATPVEQILKPDQINANPTILPGKNAAEVAAWAEFKMNVSDSQLQINQQLLTTSQAQTEDLRKRLDLQKFELENAKKTSREAATSKAIHDEELRAREAGRQLSKEERAEIEANAAAAFDRANSDLEVNRLLEQRKALLESLKVAQAEGDPGKIAEVVGNIAQVEEQLRTAIAAAIAFWQAIGGEGADDMILKFQTIEAGLGKTTAKLENQFLPSAQEINQQLADIGANAFGAFAQAIANGENAVEALFRALRQGIAEFLIDIGKAILKQALFNAIAGITGAAGGGGGGIAGTIGALFRHEGGLAGTAGGRRRAVSPLLFANAQRHHTGGLVGLQPNEVPIIAMKDEEVLTRDDPRHVMNGGTAGGGGQAINVKNVNVFDPADVMEQALASRAGERVILNFLTRNSRKVSQAISG